jgi:polyisoprenoid-binding protein YceI
MKSMYQIDGAHSSVQFVVRHMMVSNVRGTFSGVTGTVNYDPAKPAETTIDATVDVSTVDTHDEKRDGHLKSPDFFDVAKFPTMTFKSKRVESAGSGELQVTGDLTMHGVTKEVTLQVEDISGEAKDPWGNVKMGATVRGKIKRTDFGLGWNAALEAGGVLVGEDVKLDFDLQLLKVQGASA